MRPSNLLLLSLFSLTLLTGCADQKRIDYLTGAVKSQELKAELAHDDVARAEKCLMETQQKGDFTEPEKILVARFKAEAAECDKNVAAARNELWWAKWGF